jgi:glycosyltransferase involved in cell wall biosynthesis
MKGQNKRLKVFHGLVNYGTQAGVLAEGLRKKNVIAFSVSVDDNYKRKIDCHLTTSSKGLKGILNKIRNRLLCLCWFFKYNTFHFYYGTTLFPNQLDLPFYSFFGKKVIFEYLGNDVQGYRVSLEKYKWTNVNYFIPEHEAQAYDKRIKDRLVNELKYADKILVCAPVYSEFALSSEVLPLAIDLHVFDYKPLKIRDNIKIMHAPTHRGFKGTLFIIEAINKLIQEGYAIELDLVEGVTHAELRERYASCDLFVDQILGGWYGTASIEAMAIGRPVVAFMRDTYYQYVDYKLTIPVISADPDTIYEVLKDLIIHKERLPILGAQSREFVELIHDQDKVCNRLITIYQDCWAKNK